MKRFDSLGRKINKQNRYLYFKFNNIPKPKKTHKATMFWKIKRWPSPFKNLDKIGDSLTRTH